MYESQPITPRKSAPYFINTLQIFLFFKIFAFSLNRQGRNPTICDEKRKLYLFISSMSKNFCLSAWNPAARSGAVGLVCHSRLDRESLLELVSECVACSVDRNAVVAVILNVNSICKASNVLECIILQNNRSA